MVERAYKYRFFPTPAQEDLLRRTMGCVRLVYNKALAKRTIAKIKDARTDFLHKLTTRLVRENNLIAIEDLSVKNMIRNRKLARSISDSAWSEMFRQLEYKCDWYGRKLVKIDRFFPSSKRCNHCGFVMDKLPFNIRSWDCPSCNTIGIDRDINAGKNVLAAGLAVLVCGATVRPDESKSRQAGAMKQKPKS